MCVPFQGTDIGCWCVAVTGVLAHTWYTQCLFVYSVQRVIFSYILKNIVWCVSLLSTMKYCIGNALWVWVTVKTLNTLNGLTFMCRQNIFIININKDFSTENAKGSLFMCNTLVHSVLENWKLKYCFSVFIHSVYCNQVCQITLWSALYWQKALA